MFIILLSPAIAFSADYFLRRHKTNTRWAVLLIVLFAVPSILLELSGYSFSNRLYSYITTALFLTGAQLAIFTIVSVRQSVKVVASIAFLFILGFIVVGGSFLGEWGGGSRTIIKEARFDNYKALTLEPTLFSTNKVLRVKKSGFGGLLQKVVYEQDLSDTATNINCDINFRDGSKKLVFNFCKNTLGSGD
jgi:hypothetical protein